MNQSIQYEVDAVMPAAVGSGLMVSSCNIQQRTNTVSATGQPNLTTWVNIPGLQNIQCQLSIQRVTMPNQSATMRKAEELDTETQLHLLLSGHYPQILQQNQAVVDGTAYEIMAVESDSQKVQTRLAVRVWTQ